MMDGPPWAPRGSNSTTASARLPPGPHGSKKGGLAPGVASAAGSAATGLDGHGCFMARPTGRISLGPSGGPHPQPGWGLMIKENYNFIITHSPMLALIPGFAIMLLVLSFNFVGNGLRDALDVRNI